MEIRIKIENNVATLLSKEPLVCGNSDYKVVFEFDEEWNEYPAKTAMFVFNKQSVQQPFDGNICNGVSIENATVCAIGVFVGDKKASTGVTIDCMLSIKDDGTTPAPPSKDVYDELIELLNEYIKAAQGAPQGGKKGQVLKKNSDEDFDFSWQDDERADLSHYERWDYVITSVADFVGTPLSEMSGRVLVKGITIDFAGIEVDINADIKTIKFVDCEIHAKITAKGRETAIIGFYGMPYGIDYHAVLKNFNRVEHCYGSIEVNKCSNVLHCRIAKAVECTNLQDIECVYDVETASDAPYMFDRCKLIDGVRVRSFALYDDSESILEFNNCEHISNVYRTYSNMVVNYVNCTSVVGDTCDGYYTEAEKGKVQTVTTDGTGEFISVYSQEEIDGKLGDISTILTALHEGGIQ